MALISAGPVEGGLLRGSRCTAGRAQADQRSGSASRRSSQSRNRARGQGHDAADNRTGGVAVAASSNRPPHGLFEVMQMIGGTPETKRHGVLGADAVTGSEPFDGFVKAVAWDLETLDDAPPGQALGNERQRSEKKISTLRR